MSRHYDEALIKTVKHRVNLHICVILNANCVKVNAQNEFACTNYDISKVTKPYRAHY